MKIKKELKEQGYSKQEIKDALEDMVLRLESGEDPAEILTDYAVDPIHQMELIEYAL